MPGVLLLEPWRQASGWLIIGLTSFTRMPFLLLSREAKLRSFVTPGQSLIGTPSSCTKAPARHDQAEISSMVSASAMPNHVPGCRVSKPRIPRQHAGGAAIIAFPTETLSHG